MKDSYHLIIHNPGEIKSIQLNMRSQEVRRSGVNSEL